MELLLERFAYTPTETEGRLWIDDERFVFTLERPWIAGSKGGMPYKSCVPDGSYSLHEHTRPDGDVVFALRNPDLGVFYTEQEKGDRDGRFLILIHVGNWVADVVGCIAPGMGRGVGRGERMVTNSTRAMELIHSVEPTAINIVCKCGTTEDSQ